MQSQSWYAQHGDLGDPNWSLTQAQSKQFIYALVNIYMFTCSVVKLRTLSYIHATGHKFINTIILTRPARHVSYLDAGLGCPCPDLGVRTKPGYN